VVNPPFRGVGSGTSRSTALSEAIKARFKARFEEERRQREEDIWIFSESPSDLAIDGWASGAAW